MKRLLDELLIIFRYDGLLQSDVDEIVIQTKKYFRDKGFNISEGTYINLNEMLYEPVQYNEVDKNCAEEMKEYIYELDNLQISFTKKSLEMKVEAGVEYEGFEQYSRYVLYVMNEIKDRYSHIFNISRIGVKKINNLFIKDISKIGNYFKTDIFNCSKVSEVFSENNEPVLLSRMLYSTGDKYHKFNLNTEVMIGEITKKDNPMDVYRVVLDSYAYWDLGMEKFDDVDNKLCELGEYATSIYLKCLNEDFKNKLMDDSKIVDDNILGGIK